MKLTLSLLVLLAVLAGCEPRRKHVPVKNEFEGRITYHITYENYRDSAYFGDTVRTYYSHGRLTDVYNSTPPKGMRRSYYLPDEKRAYMLMGGAEPIKYFDVEMSDFFGAKATMTSFIESDTSAKFLGRSCKKITVLSTHTDGVSSYEERQVFVYAPGYLTVDKEKFRSFNLIFLNQLIDRSGAYYLYYEDSTAMGKRKFTAIDIQPIKVPDALYDFDRKRAIPLE